MQRIEELASEYSAANARLQGHIRDYNAGIAAVARKYLKAIRLNVSRMEDARKELYDALEAHPEHFEKKKLFTLHGVKLGYKKQKGKVSWPSGAKGKVVALIKKLFPSRAKDLLRVEETPDKDALAKLPVVDLKKLGVQVTEDGDAPFIKLQDSEGDKLVKEFLKTLEGKEGS